MNNAIFSTQDIFDFLFENEFYVAAKHFAQSKGSYGVITHLEVSDWFQTYFPSHNAFRLFRQLQASKTQLITLT
jgi:hypothetical protein